MKLTSNQALQILDICTAGGVPNPNENPFLTEFIKNHEYLYELFPEIKDNL